MTTSEITATYRPTLLSIAYRMTGEIMVSEDIVQDVLLNWMNRSSEEIQDAKAYLAKSVMNSSLNHLAQVKRQREAYKGVWLPEPVLTSQHAVDARLDISYGFMLLLEKLSPLERAVFVLKESFDVTYPELAELFDTTETNSRQLYHRAKEKISGANRRFRLDPQQQQLLLDAFVKGSETGDLTSLIQLLKTDVMLYSDGGGKVPAAIKPLFGRAVVEQFLVAVDAKFGNQLSLKPALINGELALLFTQNDTQQLSTVMILGMDETGINGIYTIRNPDKLAHLQGNLTAKTRVE
ncbi:RNA polymerase sigma factor SigJ [Spirosoma validum]|uniref:RNA polymerase sigma factor SigJ n=1 Tax=Spirosoma validum TaxID=2771355 RepID=A0A927B2X7_9BACT|nr:RNA polymerase sigma factor SigJ [Spirosoma validum]MBD2754353.1 RNA polymerase sigma factor SigJ [Spirosoma validum]